VLKSGRSKRGAMAAASHTAHWLVQMKFLMQLHDNQDCSSRKFTGSIQLCKFLAYSPRPKAKYGYCYQWRWNWCYGNRCMRKYGVDFMMISLY
jgi:hypothetical protein